MRRREIPSVPAFVSGVPARGELIVVPEGAVGLAWHERFAHHVRRWCGCRYVDVFRVGSDDVELLIHQIFASMISPIIRRQGDRGVSALALFPLSIIFFREWALI